MKAIVGGVVGGLILFLWSGFSWMVLPWHMQTMHRFKSDTAVIKVLKNNAPESGIYVMPYHDPNVTEAPSGPLVFTAFHSEGVSPMKQSLWVEFITQCIAAFFVTMLLMKTSGLNYFKRLGFVMVFALTVGLITHGMYWNWFKFPTNYTLVLMADLIIGWTLAGGVIAAIVGSRQRSI